MFVFFFKQKTAYEIGLGIPAEPLFRSSRHLTELSRQMTTSTTSIDIMGLQAAYANLHTDQERSEERRVGKECRTRWSPYHNNKKIREEIRLLTKKYMRHVTENTR